MKQQGPEHQLTIVVWIILAVIFLAMAYYLNFWRWNAFVNKSSIAPLRPTR